MRRNGRPALEMCSQARDRPFRNMNEVAVVMVAGRVPARAKKQPTLTKALQSCREELQMLNV